jgi:hypothetical protein
MPFSHHRLPHRLDLPARLGPLMRTSLDAMHCPTTGVQHTTRRTSITFYFFPTWTTTSGSALPMKGCTHRAWRRCSSLKTSLTLGQCPRTRSLVCDEDDQLEWLPDKFLDRICMGSWAPMAPPSSSTSIGMRHRVGTNESPHRWQGARLNDVLE